MAKRKAKTEAEVAYEVRRADPRGGWYFWDERPTPGSALKLARENASVFLEVFRVVRVQTRCTVVAEVKP